MKRSAPTIYSHEVDLGLNNQMFLSNNQPATYSNAAQVLTSISN